MGWCFFFFKSFLSFFWPKKVYHRDFILYMSQCFVYTYLQTNIHKQHLQAPRVRLLCARVRTSSPPGKQSLHYAKWLERLFEGGKKKKKGHTNSDSNLEIWSACRHLAAHLIRRLEWFSCDIIGCSHVSPNEFVARTTPTSPVVCSDNSQNSYNNNDNNNSVWRRWMSRGRLSLWVRAENLWKREVMSST